jgi:hypothetical protein
VEPAVSAVAVTVPEDVQGWDQGPSGWGGRFFPYTLVKVEQGPGAPIPGRTGPWRVAAGVSSTGAGADQVEQAEDEHRKAQA